MFARNAKWAALILAAALVSCSQQDDLLGSGAADGTEITTTVSLKAPSAMGTRGVPDVYDTTDDLTYFGESGMPSIGNLDLMEHRLTFTVGIYVEKKGADGKSVFTLVDKQAKEEANDEAYFNFRLLKRQTYRIVAYADFSGVAQEHLDSIDFTRPALNRELDDAFFVSKDFVADEHVAAVLKRPFGKLRLIARDFNTFAKGGKFKFKNVKVTYKKQGSAEGENPMLTYNRFNALTTDFYYVAPAAAGGGETPATPAAPTVTAEYTSLPAVYQAEYDEKGEAAYATVFTMYLPANFGLKDTNCKYAPVTPLDSIPQSWMYPFDVKVTYENTDAAATTPEEGDAETATPEPPTVTRSFDFDIPVKRNWLTTVDVEDFWTDNSNIKVSVDPRFDGFIDTIPEKKIVVNNVQELKDAIKNIQASESKAGKIILGQDIVWPMNAYYAQIKDCTVYLELNGHSIRTQKNGGNYPVDTYATETNIAQWRKTYEKGVTAESSEEEKFAYNWARTLLSYHRLQPGQVYAGMKSLLSSIFRVYGSSARLIIDDSSTEATGSIENTFTSCPLIWAYHGAQVTVNAGKILTNGGSEAIYAYDDHNETPATTITINGGWFGNVHPYKENGEYWQSAVDCIINGYNGSGGSHDENLAWSEKPVGVSTSIVHLNGGSFVEFNPANGDNISHNYPNPWFNSATHTILKETIDGHTVHTVIAKDNPKYY